MLVSEEGCLGSSGVYCSLYSSYMVLRLVLAQVALLGPRFYEDMGDRLEQPIVSMEFGKLFGRLG